MRLKTVENIFFFILLLLVTIAFVGLVRDFLQPIFWAAVLAVIFHPVQRRTVQALHGRASLAAVLTLLAIILIVILPLFAVGAAVTREVIHLYERIATGEVDLQAPLHYLEGLLPMATEFMERFGVEIDRIREGLSSAAVTGSRYLASQALSIGQNALQVGILFFLMLYVLFFFLRDGDRFVDALIRVLPLGDARERRLLAKFAEVSRATIKGTLVVGLVQGTLGGLLFWMLGISAPIFWGVIMTVLSLLPAIGSALVWGPAAIFLLATGEVAKGIILLVAGTLVIGLVDNLLRPILVGRDTRMPDFLILLATLGGLAVFGISGFVIGPIIAALFLAVWEMFGDEYGERHEEVEEAEQAAEAPQSEPARAAEAELRARREQHRAEEGRDDGTNDPAVD